MRRLIGNVLMLGHRMSQEDLALFLAVGQRSQFFRQAPFGHHLPGNIGRPLDIITGTGGNRIPAKNEFFGYTTAEQAA